MAGMQPQQPQQQFGYPLYPLPQMMMMPNDPQMMMQSRLAYLEQFVFSMSAPPMLPVPSMPMQTHAHPTERQQDKKKKEKEELDAEILHKRYEAAVLETTELKQQLTRHSELQSSLLKEVNDLKMQVSQHESQHQDQHAQHEKEREQTLVRHEKDLQHAQAQRHKLEEETAISKHKIFELSRVNKQLRDDYTSMQDQMKRVKSEHAAALRSAATDAATAVATAEANATRAAHAAHTAATAAAAAAASAKAKKEKKEQEEEEEEEGKKEQVQHLKKTISSLEQQITNLDFQAKKSETRANKMKTNIKRLEKELEDSLSHLADAKVSARYTVAENNKCTQNANKVSKEFEDALFLYVNKYAELLSKQTSMQEQYRKNDSLLEDIHSRLVSQMVLPDSLSDASSVMADTLKLETLQRGVDMFLVHYQEERKIMQHEEVVTNNLMGSILLVCNSILDHVSTRLSKDALELVRASIKSFQEQLVRLKTQHPRMNTAKLHDELTELVSSNSSSNSSSSNSSTENARDVNKVHNSLSHALHKVLTSTFGDVQTAHQVSDQLFGIKVQRTHKHQQIAAPSSPVSSELSKADKFVACKES